MRDGVVQQLDTPQNLYANPANLFVAAFIGSPSMNLFEATIESGHVVFGGHRLPRGRPASPATRAPVVVGIRPSDFEDAELWRDDTRAVLDVPVRVVEELGAEANVIFALDARPASTPATGARRRRRAARRPRCRSSPTPARRSARPASTPAPAPAPASGCGSRSTPPGCTSSSTARAAFWPAQRRCRPPPAGHRLALRRGRACGEHGEHAAVAVLALGMSSFISTWRTCASTVRSLRYEALGDARVGEPLGHQLEHLALAFGELGERVVVACGETRPRDDLRVERRAAAGDALGRGEELADVEHAVLEQVAEAAERDELDGVRGLDVLGEHEHADVGMRVA